MREGDNLLYIHQVAMENMVKDKQRAEKAFAASFEAQGIKNSDLTTIKGVGPNLVEKLKQKGINTCSELKSRGVGILDVLEVSPIQRKQLISFFNS